VSRVRDDALQIAAFPLLLAVGVLIIPIVPEYSDDLAAARAMEHSGRWLIGHLVSAVAFAASVQCSTVLQRLSVRPRPWVTLMLAIGAGLHAAGLGADGIGPLATVAAGVPPAMFFRGSSVLVPGVFIAGAVCFGLAQISQTVQLTQEVSSRGWRLVALIAAVTFSVAESIPSGWGLYVVALAALVLYLPPAFSVWRSETRGAGEATLG